MRFFDLTGAARQRTRPTRPLVFTPAEWRVLLNDPDFLKDPDNRWGVTRQLMGLPVRIVPDHRTEFSPATRKPLLAPNFG
jgi:hypothetical protein